MRLKANLTRWIGVIILGLCAGSLNASQSNTEKKTSYQGPCSDKLFQEFYDCRQKTRVSLKAKDDMGAAHTKCSLITREAYEACEKRERHQMGELFDEMRNK